MFIHIMRQSATQHIALPKAHSNSGAKMLKYKNVLFGY